MIGNDWDEKLKVIWDSPGFNNFYSSVLKLYDTDKTSDNSMISLFLNGVKENDIKLKNPGVTLYMIVELVSSTCFNSILYKEPLPIEEFKPYLYDLIRDLLS